MVVADGRDKSEPADKEEVMVVMQRLVTEEVMVRWLKKVTVAPSW